MALTRVLALSPARRGGLAARCGYGPAASSCQVPVTPSGAAGNWLFALVSWRQPAGYVTTVAVGDDAHNYWVPLGAPAAATPASGGMRMAIWYARNPFATQGGVPAGVPKNIYVSPTGYSPAMAIRIVEVSGLSPWATIAGIS